MVSEYPGHTDYYALLKLSAREESTQQEIITAFRKIAKECHPDKGGDPEYFKLIVTAFKTLVSTELRETYDQSFPKTFTELKYTEADLNVPYSTKNTRLTGLFTKSGIQISDIPDSEFEKKERRRLRKLKREITVPRIIPEFSPNVFNRCFEYAKANAGAGLVQGRTGGVVAEYSPDAGTAAKLRYGFKAAVIPTEKIQEFEQKKSIVDKHLVITKKDRRRAKDRLAEYHRGVPPPPPAPIPDFSLGIQMPAAGR